MTDAETGQNLGGFSRRDFLQLGSVGTLSTMYACYPQESLIGEGSIQAVISPPQSVDDHSWKDIRESFILDKGSVYMNNASLGLPPLEVVQAVTRGYRAISKDPIAGKTMLQEIITQRVKPQLSRIFNVENSQIVLTRNASEGLYLQSLGLRLHPGDEVLITTQEHPAGYRPWRVREDRDGIRVSEVFIPSPFTSKDDVINRIRNSIKTETKAVSFCHVTRGGHLYPVKELVELAQEYGLFSLVDGAQAVGQFPIDLADIGCDAYSASLHKWMLGPIGTGFLFVSQSGRSAIQTSFSADATTEAPAYAPPGTVSLPVYAALETALDILTSIGLHRIEDRCRFLSDYLKESLKKLGGVQVLSASSTKLSCPGSTIFEARGIDAVNFVSVMAQEHRIHVDEHQRDGHNAIRISTHIYNTQEEIDRLVEALKQEMKKA